MQIIKYGIVSEDVKILQALFRALQYTGADNKPIEIDGYAGSNTIYAINTFQNIQEAYGYNCGSGDSTFGPKCWQRLLGV